MFQRFFRFSNNIFVNAYKLMGFVVLTAILLGIVSYLTLSLFYLMDREWIAPIILSPSSERVIQMNSQLVQQQYNHDKLQVERMMLETQLANIERTLAANREFQARFREAISAEQSIRQRELTSLQGLFNKYLATKKEVAAANEDFARLSKRDMKGDLKAGLIEEETYIRIKLALSQNITNQIAYEQKQLEFESRSEELANRISALRALESRLDPEKQGGGGSTDYAVLLMEREYRGSMLEIEHLESQKSPLEQQIALLDASMAEYGKILATIKQSPYFKAMSEKVSIAFVPYSNLANVKRGAPIYGCSLELIWCTQVGTIVQPLDGEVATRHPMFSSELRGVMVEIELKDMKWAEEKALHSGSKPLLF